MKHFVQEAKSASSLNYPNILTIHEIEQTDSVHFIATEFIAGHTCLNICKVRIDEVIRQTLRGRRRARAREFDYRGTA